MVFLILHLIKYITCVIDRKKTSEKCEFWTQVASTRRQQRVSNKLIDENAQMKEKAMFFAIKFIYILRNILTN